MPSFSTFRIDPPWLQDLITAPSDSDEDLRQWHLEFNSVIPPELPSPLAEMIEFLEGGGSGIHPDDFDLSPSKRLKLSQMQVAAAAAHISDTHTHDHTHTHTNKHTQPTPKGEPSQGHLEVRGRPAWGGRARGRRDQGRLPDALDCSTSS